jgi:transcriptional regulator with XRE-family HTH domain
MKPLYAVLRIYRQSKGLALKNVAVRTGIPIKTLYNWESGKTKNMNINKLVKLCNFYGKLFDKKSPAN